jgi:hypothetical protein
MTAFLRLIQHDEMAGRSDRNQLNTCQFCVFRGMDRVCLLPRGICLAAGIDECGRCAMSAAARLHLPQAPHEEFD